jgi:hypothetical protein
MSAATPLTVSDAPLRRFHPSHVEVLWDCYHDWLSMLSWVNETKVPRLCRINTYPQKSIWYIPHYKPHWFVWWGSCKVPYYLMHHLVQLVYRIQLRLLPHHFVDLDNFGSQFDWE